MIINLRARNSYISSSEKYPGWSSLILIPRVQAHSAGLCRVEIIYSGPSSDCVSGYSYSEYCERVDLPHGPFHGLIALKPTESSQGYAPVGTLVRVASDFREICRHPVSANLHWMQLSSTARSILISSRHAVLQTPYIKHQEH